jgi:hypothetical protein
VSTIEELHGRKSSDSDLEIREYGRRYPSRCWHQLRRQGAVARSVQFARGLRPRSFKFLSFFKRPDRMWDPPTWASYPGAISVFHSGQTRSKREVLQPAGVLNFLPTPRLGITGGIRPLPVTSLRRHAQLTTGRTFLSILSSLLNLRSVSCGTYAVMQTALYRVF